MGLSNHPEVKVFFLVAAPHKKRLFPANPELNYPFSCVSLQKACPKLLVLLLLGILRFGGFLSVCWGWGVILKLAKRKKNPFTIAVALQQL